MKLNIKKTIYIGMAFLSISAFFQLYDLIIPLMLESTFGLNKTNTGIIMSIDNILALFLLPVIGAFSDRVRTPIGKRTPFILVGTLFAVIGMIIIPVANDSKNFLLFRVGLGIVLLATALYRSPAVALMPDLTPKSLRSKGNAIINVMGVVGSILTLISIKFLVSKKLDGSGSNYLPLFITVAIVMIIAIIILKLKINENKLLKEMPTEEHPEELVYDEKQKLHKDVLVSLLLILASIFLWYAAYNAVTTAFSRYAIKVWNMTEGGVAISMMIANVFALLSFIPSGLLAAKIGRKKTILMGVVLVTSSYLAGIFLTKFTFIVYLMFGVIGCGWAMINVNSLPMIVELSKNSDIGKYTGMYYTAAMSAQVITPIISGLLMDSLGYKALFPYALIFSILSFVTMIFVRHGNTKAEIKSKLELLGTDD